MPLTHAEVRALARPDGESTTVEFKSGKIETHALAKSLVALANTEGGQILFGVDPRGRIVGMTEPGFEDWVAQISRDKVDPPLLPRIQSYGFPEGRVVAIEVPAGPDKPYARIHDNRRSYFIRVGSIIREASAEELQRLFLASGRFHADELPIHGTGLKDVATPSLRSFLKKLYRRELASLEASEQRSWLANLGFLHSPDGPATVAGVLLFAANPDEHLSGCTITVARFAGPDVASGLVDRMDLSGPLPLLVDDSLRAVQTALRGRMFRSRGRLAPQKEIPATLLREALVNAAVHRDYSLTGRPVRLLIFDKKGPSAGQVQVRSPGRPPNRLRIEEMVAGLHSVPRNPRIFTNMAHMGYVQNLGMGVRSIVAGTTRLGRPARILVEADETVVAFPRSN